MRDSALRPSTVFWARSMALVTIFASMGMSSGRARPITQFIAPVANRRMRSSSSDRKNRLSPGSPWRPERPTQLVVDAPALVALAAQHVEAALGPDLLALGLHWSSNSCSSRASSAAPSSVSVSMPRALASRTARPSGLPPRMMSTPRPAMLVATVTAPMRPAWATISASRKCCLAFRTSWGMPRLSSRRDRCSDFDTDAVPTSTGCPVAWRSAMSSTTAANLASSDL